MCGTVQCSTYCVCKRIPENTEVNDTISIWLFNHYVRVALVFCVYSFRKQVRAVHLHIVTQQNMTRQTERHYSELDIKMRVDEVKRTPSPILCAEIGVYRLQMAV